jgi:hypothetical protein
MFATCSFDRTVAVWEECVGEYGRDGVQSNWIKKTSHVDSRTSITDVKFAPKHLGLLPTHSSQTATVLSKEQVAITWPNSGCAHVTRHTDPLCDCKYIKTYYLYV